jgi:hypothetical protein
MSDTRWRFVVSGLLALLAAGCGGASSPAPTAPTALPSETPLTAFLCGVPPAGGVHTVPAPGSTMPVSVWLEALSPGEGATVRAGEFYRLTYRTHGPVGRAFAAQVFVGDESTRGAFMTLSSGGCGTSGIVTQIPRSDRPLRLFVRLWLTPEYRVGDPPPVLTRAPDYEASEPVAWTVVP